MDYKKIDAVVCALNESRTISGVVAGLKSIPVISRVILVDDGSSDQTAQLATAAGAEVIRLEKNGGKAAAMRIGLDRVETPLTLFWDADLIGTTEEHIVQMLDPFVLRDLHMTVGVVDASGQKAAPTWSGERLIRTEAAREFFLAHPAMARFSVERELTEWAKEQGWKVEYPLLRGIQHIKKEQKRGFVKGFADRLKMYWEILTRQ